MSAGGPSTTLRARGPLWIRALFGQSNRGSLTMLGYPCPERWIDRRWYSSALCKEQRDHGLGFGNEKGGVRGERVVHKETKVKYLRMKTNQHREITSRDIMNSRLFAKPIDRKCVQVISPDLMTGRNEVLVTASTDLDVEELRKKATEMWNGNLTVDEIGEPKYRHLLALSFWNMGKMRNCLRLRGIPIFVKEQELRTEIDNLCELGKGRLSNAYIRDVRLFKLPKEEKQEAFVNFSTRDVKQFRFLENKLLKEYFSWETTWVRGRPTRERKTVGITNVRKEIWKGEWIPPYSKADGSYVKIAVLDKNLMPTRGMLEKQFVGMPIEKYWVAVLRKHTLMYINFKSPSDATRLEKRQEYLGKESIYNMNSEIDLQATTHSEFYMDMWKCKKMNISGNGDVMWFIPCEHVSSVHQEETERENESDYRN
eukprot:Nk52_evm42s554 gene=Nk52_evmTU42s554